MEPGSCQGSPRDNGMLPFLQHPAQVTHLRIVLTQLKLLQSCLFIYRLADPPFWLLKPTETPHPILPKGSGGSLALGFRGGFLWCPLSLKSQPVQNHESHHPVKCSPRSTVTLEETEAKDGELLAILE